MSQYRVALSVPGTRGPVLSALLGRLPIAMTPLSMLFYVQRESGSFAVAGVASAGVLAGVAVGSIVQGRAMDRLGPSRPLLVTAACFAVLSASAVLAVEIHAAIPALAALAFGVGATQPTIGSASRAMWTRLVAPGPVRDAAMAYEAIITEVYFVVGPALSGALLAAPWAGTGLVVAVTCTVLGCVSYALTPTMRGFRPVGGVRDGTGPGGAGLRTIALASAGVGFLLGTVEVAVPAAATGAGNAPLGGVLLGLWSVTSALAGVVYGARQWPGLLRNRLAGLLGGFAVLVMLLAVPSSLLGLSVLLLLAGVLIAPQITAQMSAAGLVAPAGTSTEAFGWIVTASTLGIGAGQAVSGLLVQYGGVRTALLGGGLVGLFASGLVLARRSTVPEVLVQVREDH